MRTSSGSCCASSARLLRFLCQLPYTFPYFNFIQHQTLSNKYAICTIGKYRNDPNIIFRADFLSPDFINEKVSAKNNTPQMVTAMAELIPVIPNVAGSKPSGMRNRV